MKRISNTIPKLIRDVFVGLMDFEDYDTLKHIRYVKEKYAPETTIGLEKIISANKQYLFTMQIQMMKLTTQIITLEDMLTVRKALRERDSHSKVAISVPSGYFTKQQKTTTNKKSKHK